MPAAAPGDPGIDFVYVPGRFRLRENADSILEELVIYGDGSSSVLDGQGRYYFFSVQMGITAYLQDLVFSNGFGPPFVGAILVEQNARLYLKNTRVTNCVGGAGIVTQAGAIASIDRDSRVCSDAGDDDDFPDDRFDIPTVVRPDRPGGRSSDQGRAKAKVKKKAYTCETLPDDIIVNPIAGTRSGIQCQVIDAAGVGRQDIINMGIIAAVDIWGWVEPGVEVCLPGQGALLFLDAAFSPRRASWLPSYRSGNTTCISLTTAGSLVLLPELV